MKKEKKKSNPCKFSKKIVICCIAFIIVYTIAQTYLSYILSVSNTITSELSPTLTTAVYAFFGTELAVSALIRIFEKEDKAEKKLEDEEKKLSEDIEDIPDDEC